MKTMSSWTAILHGTSPISMTHRTGFMLKTCVSKSFYFAICVLWFWIKVSDRWRRLQHLHYRHGLWQLGADYALCRKEETSEIFVGINVKSSWSPWIQRQSFSSREIAKVQHRHRFLLWCETREMRTCHQQHEGLLRLLSQEQGRYSSSPKFNMRIYAPDICCKYMLLIYVEDISNWNLL